MDFRLGAVIVLLLLAGCSGTDESNLNEQDLQNKSDELNLDDITLDDFDPGNFDLDEPWFGILAEPQSPWGVDDDGLYNATRLLYHHQRTVSKESHVAELWVNTTGVNATGSDTMYTHRLRRAARDGFPHTSLIENADGSGGVTERRTWTNQSIRLTREADDVTVVEPNVDYRRIEGAQDVSQDVEMPWLYRGIRYGNYETASVDGRGNDTLVTLEADGLRAEYANESIGISEYEGTVIVDGAGRIRSADVSYVSSNDPQFGPANVRAQLTFELRNMGQDLVVTKPAWFRFAIDETS